MLNNQTFSYLYQVILDYKKSGPALVGIDGVDAAGKTTFSDILAQRLSVSGRQIIRTSIDGFHNPKSIRYKQGKDSPKGYYEDSFNNQYVIDYLLKPLSSGNREYKEAAFDYRTDSVVNLPVKKADIDAILIMDGIFLFRPVLVHYWDIKIFLDVSFDITVSRAIIRARSQQSPDSTREIYAIYNRRYIPGQKLYFQEAVPQQAADIVIDNSDYNNPVVVRTRFSKT